MGTLVTEADVREIRQAAESGDEAGKAALAALPKEMLPESGNNAPEEKPKVGTEPPVKTDAEAETTPKPDGKDGKVVDQPQETPESRQRERVHPAVRRIEREKRELRELAERQQKQIEDLNKRFDAIAKPQQPTQPENDLERLIANPKEYLAENNKRLLEEFHKTSAAETQRQTEAMAKRMVERDKALKTLSSIEGYDDAKDSQAMLQQTADYLNEFYDTDEFDEEAVEKLFIANPSKYASVMKKAWAKSRQLDESTKSDKRAATSVQTETGKTSGGKPPTLETLNAKLARANAKGDRKEADAIVAEIASVLGEK